MEAINLNALLGSLNKDVVIIAVIVYILTAVIKKFIPTHLKQIKHILPFILGVIIFFIYGCLFLKNNDFLYLLNNGLSVGGTATLFYAIIKQIIKKSETLKTQIEKVLSGIISNEKLSTVVKQILNAYSGEPNNLEFKNKVYSIISSNTNVTETECQGISNIVSKTISKNIKNK